MLQSGELMTNETSGGEIPARVEPAYERVLVALIDDPPLAMRQTMDGAALGDLASSIKLMGLIEPLVVERNGERYTVGAGHRRTIAARMAGVERVPAMVYEAGQMDAEAIKTHENRFREDVNPIDEAVYFMALFEGSCGHDIDKVAAVTKNKRGHVEGRIQLLEGWEPVCAALQQNKISLGVARELNRITDETTLKMGLEWAIKGGASIPVMRQWRIEQERFLSMQQNPNLEGAADIAAQVANVPRVNVFTCACCAGEEDPHTMTQVFMHDHCKRAVFDRLMAKFNGAN